MADIHLNLALQQLRQLNSGVKILIIHPNYLAQHYLLCQVLDHDKTVYLRLDGGGLLFDDLHQRLMLALEAQQPSTDLQDVRTLVIDESDRADAKAFERFILDIYTSLSNNGGRIVLIGRQTPRFVLQKPELQNVTAFVPVDGGLMLCDYTQVHDDKTLLEVHTFGTGRVYLNGSEITDWDGVLPRSLFFYLIDRGMVTRDNIFEVFWPNLTLKDATNVFHVTKRKISEVLGTDLTTYWAGFYRISPRIDLNYDAMAFSKMVQDSAVAPPQEASNLLRRAVALYRGDFLMSVHMNWAQQRRDALQQTYGDALVALAKISRKTDQPLESLGFYLRSRLTNPQREDLVYNIMVLYRDLGMVEDALLCYERLEYELKTHLNVQPADYVRDLAAELRQRLT